MKAFWWFERNSIAGMARPGLNQTPWFDLSFEEAVLLGWIGQYSSGPVPLSSFHTHLDTYGKKILPYYVKKGLTKKESLNFFLDNHYLYDVLKKMHLERTIIQHFDLKDDHIHFEFDMKRLYWEIDFLKEKGVEKIVSLTEKHHFSEILSKHFSLHHFSIVDMDAPKFEYVEEMAKILEEAKYEKDVVAVHCLAGIGRTTTLILAACLARGEKLDHLLKKVAKQNPIFELMGPQADFIQLCAKNYS